MGSSNAPTLLIGVGGTGSKIVTRIMGRVQDDHTKRVEYVVLDTDANDLKDIKEEHPDIFAVQTSPNMTVGECLQRNTYAQETWFPRNPILESKALTEGAGQVRAISRLALEQTIIDGGLKELNEAIKQLQLLSADEFVQGVRVVITGTIAGGTGSGLYLPLGLYLKNYLKSECGIKGVNIRGFFLLPDIMGSTVLSGNHDQQENMRANGYAALRELDAFVARGDGDDLNSYPAVEFDIPRPASKERMPYPPILPYDHMFLMDNRNSDGKALRTLDNYLDYAASTIYSFAISPMSRRSNSSEDNEIRRISNVADNGHCRYAAAGSAEIVYPMDRVAEYIALLWAKDSIGKEWTELDNKLKEKRIKVKRAGGEFNYGEQYVIDFKDNAIQQSIPFYRSLWNQVEGTMKVKGETEDDKKVRDIKLFPRQAIGDAQMAPNDESGEAAPHITGVKSIAVENDGAGKYLKAIVDAARNQLEEDPQYGREYREFTIRHDSMINAASNTVASDIMAFESACEPYQRKISTLVPIIAREIASQIFSLADFRDPFDNPQPRNFEKWLIKVGGATTDVIHPNAIRYIAYQSERNLRNIFGLYQKNREILKKKVDDQLQYDYNSEKEGFQTASQAAQEKLHAKGESPIANMLAKFGAGGDTIDMEAIQIEILNPLSSLYRSINGWVDCELMCAVCEQGLNFFAALNNAFEKFYSFLDEKIPVIQRTIVNYETSKAHNANTNTESGVMGSSTRYVCSDVVSLEGIAKDTPRICDASELEGAVSANIYRAVLKMASYDLKNATEQKAEAQRGRTLTLKERRAIEQAQRNKREMFFGDTYEQSVLGFWKNQVVEQYSNVIDMDVIDALRKEAEYAGKMGDEIDNHVSSVLKTGWTLSEVFLDKTNGHNSDRLTTCMYDETLLDADDDNKRNLVAACLGADNAVSDPQLSRQQILFYQSCYGIAIKNLPKFAVPTHVSPDDFKAESANLNGGSNGGVYYRAYSELISHLSDNLSKGAYISPHLDSRWHLAFQFPDIDVDEGRRQRYNVVRAFVYSILFDKVRSHRNTCGLIYRAKNKGNLRDLRVWDGKCDEFYEIFEAMMINNQLVTSLLEDSLDSRIREINAGGKRYGHLASSLKSAVLGWEPRKPEEAAIENLPMMERIRSHAYDRNNLQIDTEKLPNITGVQSLYEIPLFYELTCPASASHGDFSEEMLDSIHEIIVSYLRNFCNNEIEVYNTAIEFFQEQFERFRCSLKILLESRPELRTNSDIASKAEAKLTYWININASSISDASIEKWDNSCIEWEEYIKRLEDEAHQ